MYDYLIVGGGVSGVTSAITYKRKHEDKKVIIIERLDDVLKKLSISGNGKGNFTNETLSSDSYNNSAFIDAIFPYRPKEKILNFFDSLGIKYVKDSEGRYYPYSQSAKTISYCLKREMKRLNIEVSLNTKVNSIEYINGIYKVSTNNSVFESRNILISAGGKNYPTLGSDGSINESLIKLGHHFTPLYPSNIYIKVKEKEITKALSGLRFNATLYLVNDNKIIYYEKGELLFKDDSLSGIVSFNVSNRLADLYKNNQTINPYILIDFSNEIKSEDLEKIISESKNLRETLMGMYNEKLVDVMLKYMDKVPLIKLMTAFPFTITSLGDFDHAQVTSGGIKTDEVKSNLESMLYKGMFFSGDILDVDAACGGFNLSFAFLSGMLTGESVDE